MNNDKYIELTPDMVKANPARYMFKPCEFYSVTGWTCAIELTGVGTDGFYSHGNYFSLCRIPNPDYRESVFDKCQAGTVLGHRYSQTERLVVLKSDSEVVMFGMSDDEAIPKQYSKGVVNGGDWSIIRGGKE